MAIKNYNFDALDSNRNLYNAQEALKRISDYKTQWDSANKSGDKATADKVAKKAQVYYQSLRDSGYSDLANAMEKTNYQGAKQIYDDFMKNNSAPATPTDTSKGVITAKSSMPVATDTSSITGKINDLYGIQRSDRETMAKKYDTLEDYNYNHNHYESDIGKSIMANYQYKGKVASDNAVAEGGASNGGNIDSYASANANRQQLAFTNAGNQAILEDFNSRINNARGILSDLGVYQQNQDKGMQTTINQHQTEEQRKFDNDVKTSEVTGVVPKSMEYSNNPYFNEDGTLINPHDTDYSLIISNAREKLKTTTNPTDRANLEQTIKDATQARAYKILHVDGYGKWAPTMETVAPTETLPSKVTNKELDNKKDTEDKQIDADLKKNENDNNTTVTVTGMNNATDIYGYDRNLEGTKYTADSKSDDADEMSWDDVMKQYDFSYGAKVLLTDYAYPVFESGTGTFDSVSTLEKYGKTYGITRLDAQRILNLYGVTQVPKKDANGNVIYKKTADGKTIVDDNGKPIPETISADDWLDSITWNKK